MPLPFVSMVMNCYKQEKYIENAVRSVLAQDYQGPMEIIISDDCSPDRTFEIIEEVTLGWQGDFDLILNRNEENLGGLPHMNRILEHAEGELVVRLHGDDISKPNRVSRIVETWLKHKPSVMSSNAEVIDQTNMVLGIFCDAREGLISLSEIIGKGWNKQMLGASMAWDRRWEKLFGPNNEELGMASDHILPFRGALAGGMYYIAEPLFQWRIHPGQRTNQIADASLPGAARHESFLCHHLTGYISCLADVEHLKITHPTMKTLPFLEEALSLRVRTISENLVRMRNKMLKAGYRPTWVPRSAKEGVWDPNMFELFPVSPKE
jgi:hypothetical protein